MNMKQRNPNIKIIGVDHSISPKQFGIGYARSICKKWIYRALRNPIKAEKYHRCCEHYISYFKLFASPSVHVQKMVTRSGRSGTISFDGLILLAEPTCNHSVFLKMDIKSSEYEIIHQIVANAHSINGVTAEFHDLVSASETFNKAIEGLQTEFVIVHIHSNNCGGYCELNDFPDTVEITFVHKVLMLGEVALTTCPFPRPELDVPNMSSLKDYELHF